MLDLLIKDARIADGTGNPWFWGEVAVRNGQIATVGRTRSRVGRSRAAHTVDARGQVVAPGFIDGHTHSDLMVLDHPETEIKPRQGVTTEVVGNCGMSCAPFSPERLDLLKSYVEPILGPTGREWSWETFSGYLDAISGAGPSENVASFVGHGTLRIAVMGFEDRPASPSELDLMKALLREALEAGAVGLSLGLMYSPGAYATEEELSELCSVLPEHDGLLATHIRGEGNSLITSIEEVARVAERSGIPLHVSHLKAAGRSNWGTVEQAMELLENARSRGLDATCDVYPYTAGSTTLTTLLPPWALEGGIPRLLARLADKATRRRIKEELRHEQENWDNLVASTGWRAVQISSVYHGPNPEIEGRDLVEIAELRGKAPADCAMDLLLEHEGKVSIVFFHMSESDVDEVVRWDRSLIASDSLHSGAAKPHPRLYGCFPRLFARYVREKKLLTLEEAVRKVTSFPAARFGLHGRGLIKPGHAADLIIFDPEEISDTATYEDPKQYPEGISHVFVNGAEVV
jgi:N-acyl-D-amino-acid deacylase